MNEIETYLQASQNLISEFYRIYYNDWEFPAPSDWQHDIHLIWVENHWVGVIWICDDFWSVEEIYTAIKYKIPEKTLFGFYSDRYDAHVEKKELWLNLYNYYKLNK